MHMIMFLAIKYHKLEERLLVFSFFFSVYNSKIRTFEEASDVWPPPSTWGKKKKSRFVRCLCFKSLCIKIT